jgi:hypothetical protein
MLERTAYKILPIITEICGRMIKYKEGEQHASSTYQNNNLNPEGAAGQPKLNMKAVLGYLNQSEWLYLLNIGNIMQITPLTVHDLYSNQTFEVELTRDSILEKVTFQFFIYSNLDQFPCRLVLLCLD